MNTSSGPQAVPQRQTAARGVRRCGSARPGAAFREDIAATVAVMLRVQPPPRASLLVQARRRARLAAALHRAGFEVAVAGSEHQVLEATAAQLHVLILTDRLELVGRVRDCAAARRLQIILITDHRQKVSEAALRAGADECLEAGASEALLQARFAAARRAENLESALRAALVEARGSSMTDELTGVASRRFFARHFPQEISRAMRLARPAAVAMCALDQLGRIRDRRGRAVADAILREFALRLQHCLRDGADWLAHLGGGNFAVVLPEAGLEQALHACRRLREAVRGEPFRTGRHRIAITASVGLAALGDVPAQDTGVAERLLSVADRALCRSEEAGGDRITAATLPCEPGGRNV